jgi:hypothetical protein
MVYGLDCKGLKPENRAENQPNMPPTNTKDTVIPKSGRDTESRDHSHDRGESFCLDKPRVPEGNPQRMGARSHGGSGSP